MTVAMLVMAGAAFAGSERRTRPVIAIPRVSHAPRLEDFLRGLPREAEIEVTDFRQYEPGDGIPASYATTAYLSYDANHLHVAFVCEQDHRSLRAHLAKREELESDDGVVLELDTFGDRRHAYAFSANPLGIQMDAIRTEGQEADESWDAVWTSEGRITEAGYVVLMSIPFRSLRYPNRARQEWGIELARMIRVNDEMATWPPTTQRIESFVGQFATLRGLEGISRARGLAILPHIAATHARYLDERESAFRRDTSTEAGIDGKMVIRDSLTLDLTENPDFSQVESDEPQVTTNERFEVFFPEKRPFFTENSGYFKTPINLFFSRRVVEPEHGLRLTGKIGPWSIGAIAIDDHTAAHSPDGTRGDAAIGVVRFQRDLPGQSTFGLFATHREGPAARNRLVALDSRIKSGANWVATLQLARSEDEPPDGTRATGIAGRGELAYTGRNLVWAARFDEITPEFRSDLGYVPRADIRKAEQYFRYYWKPDGRRVLLFGPDVTLSWNWNHEGELQERIVDASAGANLRGPIGLGCRHVDTLELFEGRRFGRAITDCGISVASLESLEWDADLGRGTAIVYRPAAGLAPFLANTTTAKAGLTFRPTPRFRLGTRYIYTATRLAEDSVSTPPQRHSVYRNDLGRVTMNYQFSRPLSLRLILDYDAVLPNRSVVALERAQRLTADVLLTWMLHPGTAIYVGYTERRENLAISDPPEGMRRTRSLDLSTGRQLFVKITYLFQM